MKTHFQIIIIGGGNAGLSVAAKLLLKNPKLDIAIVEPSSKHYYQPAWTLVGGGAFDINLTVRNEKDFIPKQSTWIQDKAVSFDPTSNKVTTEKSGDFTYDYMVVCPGIQLDWHKVKGLKETLGKNNVCSNYLFELAPYTLKSLEEFKGGNAVFTNPNTPIKCGGAPQKAMYLSSDFLRKRGLLDKTNVSFYSGGGVIFGVKEFAVTLNKVIERYGIHTFFKHNLVEIDGNNKKAFFETQNENGETVRKEVNFDFNTLRLRKVLPTSLKTVRLPTLITL
jgi:sulfide:quinone oxidoreductase